MRTSHRTLIALAAAAVALAACGGDDAEPVAAPQPPASTDVTATTAPQTDAAGYDHATGADDVVLRIDQEGGFMTIEGLFARLPNMLVTGDGRVFTPAPQIEIYPGPLVPGVQIGDLGEDGLQELLALADEHGLLQDREYDSPQNIADASDTVVTVTVGGETYVHRAYALGMEDGLDASGGEIDDAARQELSDFIAAAQQLGDPAAELFEPTEYLVVATPIDDLSGYDIEPTIVPWAFDTRLDAAADCVAMPAAEVGEVLVGANQLTFFEQDGVTYLLGVKPAMPGVSC